MNRFGLLEDFLYRTNVTFETQQLDRLFPKFHLSEWINLLFDSEHNSSHKLS